MKKLFLAILFIAALFTVSANAQLLTCSTYTSNTEDSIAIAGSTDAGSDYFTNDGYNEVWLQVHNGVGWYAYKLNYPTKHVSYFSVDMEGSDTTLTVLATTGGIDVIVPLTAITGSTIWTNTLDITGVTPFRIRFRGFR